MGSALSPPYLQSSNLFNLRYHLILVVGDDYDYDGDFDNFQCQFVAVAVAAILRLTDFSTFTSVFSIVLPVGLGLSLVLVNSEESTSAFSFFRSFMHKVKKKKTI